MRCKKLLKATFFFAVVGYLFWRCQFGFADLDESIYLSIPYRFCLGDGPFIHEWNVSMLSAFILYPLVKLHLLLFGGTEAIFIHFRFLFTGVMTATSAWLYFKWRKYNDIGAFVGSIAFLLSCPHGIMALSYNTMAIIGLAIAVTCYYTNEKHRWLDDFIAGVGLMIAAFGCPFLGLLYLIYSGVALSQEAHRKRWLMVSAGCALIAMLQIGFILSRATLSDITTALPLIMQDPEHVPVGIVKLLQNYIEYALMAVGVRSLSAFTLTGLLLAILPFSKNQKGNYAAICFVIILLLVSFLLWRITIFPKMPNYYVYPMFIFAFAAISLSRNKNVWQLAAWTLSVGVIYGFCVCLGSNQGRHHVCSAGAVCIVPAFVLWFTICQELKNRVAKKFLRYSCSFALAFACIVQQGVQLYSKYDFVFWDRPIRELTEHLDTGVMKGLKVSAQKAERYHNFINRTAKYTNVLSKPTVLFMYDWSWMYLQAQCPFGTYSPYAVGRGDAAFERHKSYYDLHHDKLPTFIYSYTNDVEQIAGFCKQWGFHPTEKFSDGAQILMK